MKRWFVALSILAASISLAHASPMGGSALSKRALNPQPLPPGERGRHSGSSRDQSVLPNGIIIVGGKNGGAR